MLHLFSFWQDLRELSGSAFKLDCWTVFRQQNVIRLCMCTMHIPLPRVETWKLQHLQPRTQSFLAGKHADASQSTGRAFPRTLVLHHCGCDTTLWPQVTCLSCTFSPKVSRVSEILGGFDDVDLWELVYLCFVTVTFTQSYLQIHKSHLQ